ncbi:MAG: hypothetical protein O7B35_00475 [Deltaproteobacteria bacterium]|nr:hypothetical protein [Deltaproteobacteria bacterium]
MTSWLCTIISQNWYDIDSERPIYYRATPSCGPIFPGSVLLFYWFPEKSRPLGVVTDRGAAGNWLRVTTLVEGVCMILFNQVRPRTSLKRRLQAGS